MAASKPAPAMTPKRSSLEAPDVELAAMSAQANCDRTLDIALGSRGSSRRGLPSRLERRRDSSPCQPARRRSAGPSRHRPRRTRARRPRPARARPARTPSWPSGTSYQSGSSTPAASSTRRSSGSPPSSVFVGVCDDRDLHATARRWRARDGAGRPRRRASLRDASRAAGEQQHEQRADPDRALRRRRRAGGASRGTCGRGRRGRGSRRNAQADMRRARVGNREVSSSTRPA